MQQVPIRYGLVLLCCAMLFASPLAGSSEAASETALAIADAGAGNEPPRLLRGRALNNLVAFTRLLGYVRFFHPSDQAVAADWSQLAIAGVRTVEEAASAEELAAGLETIFHPIAPTVRVFPADGPEPALPPELSPPADGSAAKLVTWRHFGVGLGNSAYKSERIDDQQHLPATPGSLTQYLRAAPYRGQRLRLRAWVRAELAGEGTAKLWLEASPERWFFDESASASSRPIAAGDWRAYEIEVDVGDDANKIGFGITLYPQGRVWIDAVSLTAVDGEVESPIALSNPDLEAGETDAPPTAWWIGRETRLGYRAAVSEERARSGRRCGLLEWEKPEVEFPDPREPFAADLGGGVRAWVPLVLYADGEGTLPHLPEPPAPPGSEGFRPSGDDRATRLADVVLAWNVFQHFYPYSDVVENDWPGALLRALSAAAADPDARAFLDTLRRLVAELHGSRHHGVGARAAETPESLAG